MNTGWYKYIVIALISVAGNVVYNLFAVTMTTMIVFQSGKNSRYVLADSAEI